MTTPITPSRHRESSDLSSTHVNSTPNISSSSSHATHRYTPCPNACRCLNVTVHLTAVTPGDNIYTHGSLPSLYQLLTSNTHSPFVNSDVSIGKLHKLNVEHIGLLEERCIQLQSSDRERTR